MRFYLKQVVFILVIPFFILSIRSNGKDDLYSKIASGCVEILVGGRLDGSGVILAPNGMVMTAYHVIKQKDREIEALSPSLGRLPLRLVATNRGSDLALLSLPEKKDPYSYLPLAKEVPKEGTRVFLMGSPIFRHYLMLQGSIARRTESYSWYDRAFTNTFPITGIAAPGTSGGPWVNNSGQVFAIQVAGVTTDSGHQGVNSAVSIPSIKFLLENQNNVSVPTIESAVEELWGQPPNLINIMPKGIRGLLFRQVLKDGASAKAGIEDENIMLKADNLVFQRIEPFVDYLRSRKVGSNIQFEICDLDGKNEREITVKIAELK